MKTKLILVGIALFSLVNFTGCKKYDEGPAFSLKGAKGRISKNWKLETVIKANGEIYTNNTRNTEVEFKRDDNFIASGSEWRVGAGTWQFGDDKKNIVLTYIGYPAFVDTYKILKLKNDELWLSEVGSSSWEYHFVKK